MDKRKVNRPSTADLIARLYSLQHSFSRDSSRRKLDIVRELSARTLRNPSAIIKYHDILCFMQAYPDNTALLETVDRELAEFQQRVEIFRRINGPDDDRLDDTGIVETATRYPYSYLMAHWLLDNFGPDVDIDWDDYSLKEDDPISGLLSIFSLYAENDGIDDEGIATEDWVKEAHGPEKTSLAWLLEKIDSLAASPEVRQQIYDDAEIGLRWFLGKSKAARTLVGNRPEQVFYQRSDLKKIHLDLRESGRKTNPGLRLLPAEQGAFIIDTLIRALLPRHRELYPATYANPSEIYESTPGRGLRVFILGMRPNDRMPLEANYSALLMKNGVPIGYGIAVLFFERCEIAINVFDTFRSAEASIIFEHFFRVFNFHFGARVLIMRRWQVGHENEEGLQSGSFWFYYKLGFRPMDGEVEKLARAEMEKIGRDRSYRCDTRTLKKLAVSDLLVDLRREPRPAFKELSVSDIGLALTRYIALNFAGDSKKGNATLKSNVRRALGNPSLSGWTRSERLQFSRWSPVLGMIPDLAEWRAGNKRNLLRIIRSKGADREKSYVGFLQRHHKLKEALAEIAGLGAH